MKQRYTWRSETTADGAWLLTLLDVDSVGDRWCVMRRPDGSVSVYVPYRGSHLVIFDTLNGRPMPDDFGNLDAEIRRMALALIGEGRER